MKILAFILSIYLLALTIAPCSDGEYKSDDTQIETVILSDFGHDHGASQDQCTPFCQCHCCHIHVVFKNNNGFDLITSQIPTNIFAHFDSFSKAHLHTLFQPPQV